MKRKILVFLLTFSLVLSYMPMIAFADVEAEESASVNEMVEDKNAESAEAAQGQIDAEEVASEEHAQIESKEEVEESAEEADVLDETPSEGASVQVKASADDVEECAHENTWFDEVWDWDKVEYIDIGNNQYHIDRCPGYLIELCEDCGEEISREAIQREGELSHNYEDGECVDCGHKNTCTHENAYTREDLDWGKIDSIEYTDIGDNRYHRVTGPGYRITLCDECGEIFSKEDIQIIDDEYEHYYRNGECYICGHKNTCAHENTYTNKEWDWELIDEVTYSSIDDRYHIATGPGYEVTWCDDCGEEISREAIQREEKETHSYEDGECVDCGHKNTCAHENTYTYDDWEWDEVKYTDTGDNQYHHVKGQGYEITWCDDCESEVSKEPKQIDGEYEHNYEDGECVECGHVNTCAHENTYTEEEWAWELMEEVTYSSIDDRYHIATGPGYEVTYCDDCGEEISRETIQRERKETHDYEDGECVDCGHKNTCAHENSYTYDDWEWDEVKYTDTGDNHYHHVKGPGYEVTWCDDCESEVSKEPKQIDGEYEHYYEDGECVECGHVNTCAHENTQTGESWNDDEVEYTDTGDDRYHHVKGPGYEVTWCDDCGEWISEKAIQIDGEYEHNYVDGVCVDCGHENTCEHKHTVTFDDWDPDEVEITDTGDDEYHHVTGPGYEVTWCEDCETEISRRPIQIDGEYEHYFEDGVCVECGHEEASYDERIYGSSRYDTAIEAAERYMETTGSKLENVIVAYGLNFPDALSGGYLSKVKNAPILLVDPTVETRIADYISENLEEGGTVYILGGTGVVSSSFQSSLDGKGITTERLGGASRYETNLLILQAAGVTDEEILVCTGAGFADSLSAAAAGLPILLVGDTLTEGQQTYIKSLGTEKFYLIGGTGAVGTTIEDGLKSLGYSNIERLAGRNRYETSTAVAKKFFETAATVVLAYALNYPDGLSGGPLALIMDAPIILTDSNNTTAAAEYVKSADVIYSITLGGPALISDIAVQVIMSSRNVGSGD